MAGMAAPLDVDRPFTVADLDAAPADGRRRELVDGQLLVSPGPSWSHQEAALALYRVLWAACPGDLRVLAAPFGVRADRHNEVQPDVLVARYTDLREAHLPVAPLLAVEVVSRSSGLTDRNLKRAVYARLGVEDYWLVDPSPAAPALTALTLTGGDYRQIAHVVGDTSFTATSPFPVTIVPTALMRGRLP